MKSNVLIVTLSMFLKCPKGLIYCINHWPLDEPSHQEFLIAMATSKYMSTKSKFHRKPAKLMRLRDIYKVETIEFDEMTLFKFLGQPLHKIHVMATVVEKYQGIAQNGKKFAVLTVDDGTATIRVKQWVEIDTIEKCQVGEIIDIVGKPRVFEGEIYISPEIINTNKSVTDELLRRAELIEQEIELYGLKPDA